MTQHTAQTLVLATRNAGKIRELNALFATRGLTVVGLDAFPDVDDVEETGTTFEENALLKARAAATATGCVAV
ncbi:MAG: non-canonical purine NTP pyrophosphatase, partial [Ottowia sp.]|nr:non-canonical purine NTP pyrophosphatase [Ottowia sp.]